MAWVLLGVAIGFEVAGTICLKLSEGFTRLLPSLAILPLYGCSFALLVVVLKSVPVSTAYAVWSAMGTALVATIGILWFREPASLLKIGSLALIIVGVVGLHMADRLAP